MKHTPIIASLGASLVIGVSIVFAAFIHGEYNRYSMRTSSSTPKYVVVFDHKTGKAVGYIGELWNEVGSFKYN